MTETLEQVTAQLAQAVDDQKGLVSERDALKQEMATLTAQVATLITQVATLTEEKKGLEDRIAILEKETGARITAHRIQVLEMAGSKLPDDESEDAKKKLQEAIASMTDDAFNLFVGATKSGGQSPRTGSGGFSPGSGKGEKKLTL